MNEEQKKQFISDVLYFYQYRSLDSFGAFEDGVVNFPELNMAWNNLKIAELALRQAVNNLDKE